MHPFSLCHFARHSRPCSATHPTAALTEPIGQHGGLPGFQGELEVLFAIGVAQTILHLVRVERKQLAVALARVHACLHRKSRLLAAVAPSVGVEQVADLRGVARAHEGLACGIEEEEQCLVGHDRAIDLNGAGAPGAEELPAKALAFRPSITKEDDPLCLCVTTAHAAARGPIRRLVAVRDLISLTGIPLTLRDRTAKARALGTVTADMRAATTAAAAAAWIITATQTDATTDTATDAATDAATTAQTIAARAPAAH